MDSPFKSQYCYFLVDIVLAEGNDGVHPSLSIRHLLLLLFTMYHCSNWTWVVEEILAFWYKAAYYLILKVPGGTFKGEEDFLWG